MKRAKRRPKMKSVTLCYVDSNVASAFYRSWYDELSRPVQVTPEEKAKLVTGEVGRIEGIPIHLGAPYGT